MNQERGYVLHKSRQSAEAVLTNVLGRAPGVPYAIDTAPSERRGTVVVVGAGPSLDRTAHHLPRLIDEGATVFTVNTALPRVAQHCEPDVVVAREIVDVSAHMSHLARLRVLDVGAHPRVWQAAMRVGACAWFVPGVDQLFALAHAAEVRPLFGGQASLTSAVSLANEWGAARIVLLGCDLAIDDDGRSYADGTAFGGQRAIIGADNMAENGGPGFAAKQAAHEAAGIKAWPEREITCVLERWGGGEPLRTTTQWLDQVHWLATFAARHPDVECIDATGGGARKPGWTDLGADAVHAESGVRGRLVALDAERMRRRVREHLSAQVERACVLAANTVHPHGSPTAIPGIMQGIDFVEFMAARDVTTVCEAEAGTLDKIRAVYGEHGAYMDAARRMREMLSAA